MSKRTYRMITRSTTAIAIATAGIVMMMAGCASGSASTGDASEAATTIEQIEVTDAAATDAGEIIGMPNPIVEYDTLEAAEKAAGFEFAVPEAIDGYENVSWSVIAEETIQVIYTNADGEEITIRKAAGDEDISGDYTIYDDERIQEVDGHQVTMRGSADKVCLAIWTDAGYSYSVMTSDGEGLSTTDAGMTLEDMSAIVAEAK